MNAKYSARDAIDGVVRLEREIVELYRRVAEHEKRARVGARLQILEARHLSAASRSERILEEMRRQEGGGIFGDLASQISNALVGLIAGVPIEFIEETHTPTLSTLKRFERRLHECYVALAEEVDAAYHDEAVRGASESRANIEELEAMELVR